MEDLLDKSVFRDEEEMLSPNEQETTHWMNTVEAHIDGMGNPVYLLPGGRYLYHANNVLFNDLKGTGETDADFTRAVTEHSYLRIPYYFSNHRINIERYGCRYEFRTKRALRLLALDALTPNSPFYQRAPKEIQKILVENYGVGGTRVRNSSKEKDDAVVKYVCDEGEYDGYMTKQMRLLEENSGGFHPEIVLCRVLESVQLVQRLDSDGRCQEKLMLQRSLRGMEERRLAGKNPAKRRALEYNENPLFGMNFGSSPDPSPLKPMHFGDSPDPSPVKRPFFAHDDDDDDMMLGGTRRRKSRKGTKRRGTKRTKKSNKRRTQRRKRRV